MAQRTRGIAGLFPRVTLFADQFPAGRVDAGPHRAVTAKPVHRCLALLVTLALAAGLLTVCLPRLAWTEWNRFADPYGNVPPFSWTQLEVSPGDTKVLYGSPLEISVLATGRPVDQVELVIVDTGNQEESLPLFPEPDGRWRAVLSKVTEPATYYARSYRSRSRRYRIDVITVPRIEDVRLRVIPPDYTRLAPYEGPLPADGVAGLPGTRVEIRARSNRPLSGGKLSLLPREPMATEGASAAPKMIEMTPIGPGAKEVSADFQIQADGKFELKVIDADGQASLESFSGAIVLLADQRPFIRLTQPRPVSLATPQTALPVVASAEDDYGISGLKLFRSLNGSRPLPMDLRLAQPPPRRVYESVYLPLDKYGLTPGDVIKLFGRVTDNDPAGAKGAESSVVEVRIISQEEFERYRSSC